MRCVTPPAQETQYPDCQNIVLSFQIRGQFCFDSQNFRNGEQNDQILVINELSEKLFFYISDSTPHHITNIMTMIFSYNYLLYHLANVDDPVSRVSTHWPDFDPVIVAISLAGFITCLLCGTCLGLVTMLASCLCRPRDTSSSSSCWRIYHRARVSVSKPSPYTPILRPRPRQTSTLPSFSPPPPASQSPLTGLCNPHAEFDPLRVRQIVGDVRRQERTKSRSPASDLGKRLTTQTSCPDSQSLMTSVSSIGMGTGSDFENIVLE